MAASAGRNAQRSQVENWHIDHIPAAARHGKPWHPVPLPAETRRLLLLAAAEPVGDVPLLWRAAERLNIGRAAAGAAEAAGLVAIGARVRFRHPLVRSAAYQAAPAPERREVHRALADATDARLDPDRRAWHRARASDGPAIREAAPNISSTGAPSSSS